MNTSVHFSRATDEWPTPQWLFEALNREFGFTLDPCSSVENAKCKKHYTIIDSGLLKDWGAETVFMNPPYSECRKWMEKAYNSAGNGATVVCLVPSRTDTVWWHRFAMRGEIRFIKGRLTFGDAKNSAPFPSVIIVFRPRGFLLSSFDVERPGTRRAELL